MDEAFRERVMTQGPVGAWTLALGTAAALSDDMLMFRADGEGVFATRSVAFGEEAIAFAWRMAGPGMLEVREIDPAEPAPWIAVAMEFRRVETDAGAVTALTERGRDGFWLAQAPLAWLGIEGGP